MAVQARTLEIYSKMGIIDQALDRGFQATGANMWTNGKWAARIPVGEIGKSMSPFPFVLMLGQDDNERIMGAKLREYGVDIQWNTELVSLEQKPEGVAATLKQPDGSTRIVRASWVGGCDGSRSAVRELNGITFPGAPYEHVFFVADTEVTGPMVPDELNVYLWRQGFHLFFPMRGTNHWRVVGILPRELRGRDDLTFADVIPSVRQEAGTDVAFKACSWYSTYRIHHRCAARFRDRRCFLLGDAAHIHSPVGAQGMNTGLQDAYNLAWKLALVVKRRASAALLDSYEAERIPVAKRLLSTTDRAFSLIVSDSWVAGLLRTQVLAKVAAFAMRFDRVRKLAFLTIAQIGIQYRDSRLSESQPGLSEDAPRAGDRFPWLRLRLQPNGAIEDLFAKLDDTQFNLIVVGQPVASTDAPALRGLLRVHAVSSDAANDSELARARIPRPSFYLLRPDGHVGLAGTQLDTAAVTHYVSERLKLTAS
jgi:2-polyprenyl-6-methoxyphenol hydroxylase-like FAD-dependent oxidoreductase